MVLTGLAKSAEGTGGRWFTHGFFKKKEKERKERREDTDTICAFVCGVDAHVEGFAGPLVASELLVADEPVALRMLPIIDVAAFP